MASMIKLVVPFIIPPTAHTVSSRFTRSKFVSQGMPPPTAAVQRRAAPFSRASTVSSV